MYRYEKQLRMVVRPFYWLGPGILFLSLLQPSLSHGQKLTGFVLTEDKREAITHASVDLLDEFDRQVIATTSDSHGRFTLDIPTSGTFSLLVRHVAYTEVVTPSFDVGEDESLDVEVYMNLHVRPLEPLVVVVTRQSGNPRLEEFYRRAEQNRRFGRGRIMFREDIEHSRPASIQNILARSPAEYRAGRECAPEFYIDGLSLGTGEEAAIILDATTEWADVEGVEVYRGLSETPIQYQTQGADCAVVLVWTGNVRGEPLNWWRAAIAGGLLLLIFF